MIMVGISSLAYTCVTTTTSKVMTIVWIEKDVNRCLKIVDFFVQKKMRYGEPWGNSTVLIFFSLICPKAKFKNIFYLFKQMLS